MIKAISKISVTVLLFILIISKPVINDYGTRIKYSIDTHVITYDERKFLLENPQYYIYYKDNEPYIATKENLFNIWTFDNVYNQKARYSINENSKTLYISKLEPLGYVQFLIDVRPSQEYYLTFDRYFSDILVIVELMTKSGSKTTVYEDYLYKTKEITFITRSTTERLRVRFYNPYNNEVNNITIFNFWLNEGLENKQYEIINRPAKTYIKEHAPYDYIGHKVIGGFMDLVSKINRPKEFIAELTGEVKEFIVKLIFF